MAKRKATTNTGRAVLMMLDMDCLAEDMQRFRDIEEELGTMCVMLYSECMHIMAHKGEPEEGLWLKADGLQAIVREEKLMFNHIAGGRMSAGRGRPTRKRSERRLHGCAA